MVEIEEGNQFEEGIVGIFSIVSRLFFSNMHFACPPECFPVENERSGFQKGVAQTASD
jgi:hypothetical protein